MLATGRSSRLKRRSRPVNSPLSAKNESVNGFLQICFVFFETQGFLRVEGDRVGPLPCKSRFTGDESILEAADSPSETVCLRARAYLEP